jgi:hypothetical protein
VSIKQKRAKCIISQDFLMGERENEKLISFKPFLKNGDADVQGIADALSCLITKIGRAQVESALVQAVRRTSERESVSAIWSSRVRYSWNVL